MRDLGDRTQRATREGEGEGDEEEVFGETEGGGEEGGADLLQ